MAIRPDKCILRGEIDNTVRGVVTATLWFTGRHEPLTLELSGDAWADVAGSRLTFTNPSRQDDGSADGLATHQTGHVGDITVSSRRKVFTVPEDEWRQALDEDRIAEIPFVWKNVLYFEWFSTANGRVVVESADYDLTVSERQWIADDDDDAAQKLLNMEAMRDFLDGIIDRPDPGDAKWPHEMTEDEWEESLKESDRLTDAAMEAAEKFRDDPDADTKEAFVMGWDHLNAALHPHASDGPIKEWPRDDDEEEEELEPFSAAEDDTGEEDESDDDDDWDFERHQHPVARLAHDYCLHINTLMRHFPIPDAEQGQGTPMARFHASVLQISGKLAGALNWSNNHRQPDGYILAITRRCLNWANEALAALAELESAPPTGTAADHFGTLRPGLFKVRDAITELRGSMGRP